LSSCGETELLIGRAGLVVGEGRAACGISKGVRSATSSAGGGWFVRVGRFAEKAEYGGT